MIKPDFWTGCYKEAWKGFMVDEAFCHPAKFSHALIGRIYDHALKNGWVKEGQWIEVTKEIRESIKKELDNGLYLQI